MKQILCDISLDLGRDHTYSVKIRVCDCVMWQSKTIFSQHFGFTQFIS